MSSKKYDKLVKNECEMDSVESTKPEKVTRQPSKTAEGKVYFKKIIIVFNNLLFCFLFEMLPTKKKFACQ